MEDNRSALRESFGRTTRSTRMAPTFDEIERRADVLARKQCTLIVYLIELVWPTSERSHLKGCKEFGQILRPSANPQTTLATRLAERIRHCNDGQRTPGFYYLLHEQGMHRFRKKAEVVHRGLQGDLMTLGDNEESRLVRDAGGTFRSLGDKGPQSLNFKKPGQGDARMRLLAKARAELNPTLLGVHCQ